MKKRAFQVLSFFLVAMQLLAFLSVAVSADATNISSMDVCKTSATSMSLDGKVSDGEAWDLVSWSSDPFLQIGTDSVPEGSDIRFKVLWATDTDKAYLYFLIDVSDTTLDSTSRAWNKDNVRVFLDEDGVAQDSDKVQNNQENYGSLYVSSEFMSYVNHSYNSKGFEYKTEKKADDAGYVVEVKYTFQDASKAAVNAEVRANIAAVFGNATNGAQFVWSMDSAKWAGGLNNKDYFAHAGVLKLTDNTVEKPVNPAASAEMNVLRTTAADMTLDGAVTQGEAWESADWNTNAFRQIGSETVPEGSGVKFKTLWATDENGAYLYFLIDIDDTILNATGRAWNQDNVRVFLDEDGICDDNVKPIRNSDTYGSVFASSEFMSYAPNSYSSKGFDYAVAKKEGDTGYTVEVRYTYQNAALAVADATVRANLAVVFADSTNTTCAQFLWSWDADKWAAGLTDKEYFAHTGSLKLSATVAESGESKPDPTDPVPAVSIVAKQTTVDSVKIDGKVNANDVWDQVEWSDYAVPYTKMPIATPDDPAYDESYKDFGFRFKTLWAKDGSTAYVYFLIDVNDKNMTSTKRAWACDNVRIFLNEDGNAPEGTLAKRNRESVYASSEFMSYATTENSVGYKYRVTQKADGSGYLLEVQYTLENPTLAAAGNTMKLNVVANDADSTNDDGSHFAQQFAWSWNSSIWSVYTQIDCIEHAGTLTLSDTLVALENSTTTGSEEETSSQPQNTDEQTQTQPGTNESPTNETPAGDAGCNSSVGFGLIPVLSLAGLVLIRRKKRI